MKTFLLYWNPYFSSYKLDRFLEDFDFSKEILTIDEDAGCFPYEFNWSVIEHEKVHEGDRFFFVKVGYDKPTGIIGTGRFLGFPYEDQDWSGQGRRVFYADMFWECVVKPDSDKILPTSKLIEAIPEVEWIRGKAGVEVAPEIAAKIEALWKEHLEAIK